MRPYRSASSLHGLRRLFSVALVGLASGARAGGEADAGGARAGSEAPAPERKGRPRGEPAKVPPTHRDVRYGPHERNVLDLWLAESKAPTPLVIYIHGGGFRGGSKENLNARTTRELLAAGISVAAIHYRLLPGAPLPAAHHDARRALQFIRSRAKEWNIDKARIGAFGGSAGAQLCMYLGFHDDMADPASPDPVERESSRLRCLATNGGQTTMDFDWWGRWIPGVESPDRGPPKALFGAESKEKISGIVKDISALSLISADDPPIFMSYAMRPDDAVPADRQKAWNWKIHHVIFGIKLKEKMDALGIEADLRYPGARTKYASIPQFFIAKLTAPRK